jgi:hypothetical protein
MRSNYEHTCDKCGQPIKPQTDYDIERRYENFRGQRIMRVKRIHRDCPGVKHEEK